MATFSTARTGFRPVDSLLSSAKWNTPIGQGTELSYSINSPADSSLYSSTVTEAARMADFTDSELEAVHSAFQSWGNVANIQFNLVAPGGGEIRVGKSELVTEHPSALAWAYLPDTGRSIIDGRKTNIEDAGDIWLDTVNRGPNDVRGEFYHIMLHEIGHAIGLDHSFSGDTILPEAQENNQYTIMSYTPHSQVAYFENSYRDLEKLNPSTPMLYDIAAAQHLYGANLDYNAGDTHYKFTDAAEVKTVWDGGGTDHFDFSALSQGVKANLTAGSFSSVGKGLDFYGDTLTSQYTFDNPFDSDTGAPILVTGDEVVGQDGTTDGSLLGRQYSLENNIAIAFDVQIENLSGTQYGDILIGNNSDNYIHGNGGSDWVLGGGGNDVFATNADFEDLEISHHNDKAGQRWTVIKERIPADDSGGSTGSTTSNSFADAAMISAAAVLNASSVSFAAVSAANASAKAISAATLVGATPEMISAADTSAQISSTAAGTTVVEVGAAARAASDIESAVASATSISASDTATAATATIAAATAAVTSASAVASLAVILAGINSELTSADSSAAAAVAAANRATAALDEAAGIDVGNNVNEAELVAITESVIRAVDNAADAVNVAVNAIAAGTADIVAQTAEIVVDATNEAAVDTAAGKAAAAAVHLLDASQAAESNAIASEAAVDALNAIDNAAAVVPSVGAIVGEEPNAVSLAASTWESVTGNTGTNINGFSDLRDASGDTTTTTDEAVYVSSFLNGIDTLAVNNGFVNLRFYNADDSDAQVRVADKDDVSAVARLYKAALDRDPDESGLNYWLGDYEQGSSLQNIAQGFVDSAEFKQNFNVNSDKNFITALYENVLNRAPDQSGLNYWLNDINNGGASYQDVLVSFSESAENKANTVELVGAIHFDVSDGLWGV